MNEETQKTIWVFAGVFIAGMVIGGMIGFSSGVGFNEPKTEIMEYEETEINLNYLNERFNRLETAVINTSTDKCLVLGGVYPVDVNGMPSLYEWDYLVDANKNAFMRVPMWPCLFFPPNQQGERNK